METVESVEPESLPPRWVQDPRRLVRNGAIIAGGSLLLSFATAALVGWLAALPEGTEVKLPTIEAPPAQSGTTDPGVVASEATPPQPVARDTVSVPSKKSFVEPILKRNIFDSTMVGLAAEANKDPTGGERRTDLKLTLLATVVAIPEDYSSCLISSDESKNGMANGYGIGDLLLGEATVIKIQQKKVYIRRTDGTIEFVDMDGDKGGKQNSNTVSLKGAPEEGMEGVTKLSDNSYQVDKSVLSEALANLDQLATQVRAIPHRGPDGQIDGYRLSAIRRGSLMSKLGVKNGDVIHSVNGMSLSNTSDAMGALQRLQGGGENSFSFDITRRNQKQSMQYEIR